MNLRDNNFNLIKTIAAFVVLFVHCFPLAGVAAADFHMNRGLISDLGSGAVNLFFAISGFLVGSSYLKNSSLSAFIRLRSFRLVPALAAHCFLCAFILGPVFTTLPLAEYFSHKDTYDFFINNSLFIHTEYYLPGVFSSLPYPDAINGSLWTLRFEAKMYLLLAVMGVLGVFTNRRLFYVMAAVYAALWLAHTFYPHWIADADSHNTTKRISLYFILGACMQIFAKQIVYSWKTAFGLVVLALLLKDTGINQLSTAIAGVYAVFCFSTLATGRIRNFNKLDDVSYGFYLYAFPVQQALIALVPGIGFWGMLVCATVISWIFGWLSWRLVEKPALDYCARLNKQLTTKND